jgi:epsin
VGSNNICIYFQDNIYIIKSLSEFQYVDEDGKDQGANVRQKAIDITNLLRDERRLREERLRAQTIWGGDTRIDDGEDDGAARSSPTTRPQEVRDLA